MTHHTQGLLFAIFSFVSWGVLPLYWKLFSLPALDLALYRMLFSAISMFIIVALIPRYRKGIKALSISTMGKLFFVGSLLSINWLVYVWAIQEGRVLECSLGYYINPLVSVFLGAIFLKESISKLQTFAILFAAIGIVVLSMGVDQFPWVALTLAATFGTYGLFKKSMDLEPISSFAIESISMMVWVFIGFNELLENLPAVHSNELGLIASTGLITALPLILYNIGVQKIPLGLVGMLQFIAPTIKFLLGIWIFNEPFGTGHFFGFCFIWIGVIIYIAPQFKFAWPQTLLRRIL